MTNRIGDGLIFNPKLSNMSLLFWEEVLRLWSDIKRMLEDNETFFAGVGEVETCTFPSLWL